MHRYGRCTVHSSTLVGVEGMPVDVEVVVSGGLPGIHIVGMPDTSVQEARERIKAAIQACDFVMPGERVVINLAPGNLRKVGTGFDLPIAVGLLAATGQINPAVAERFLFVGELSLQGFVRSVPGQLSHALCAKREGYDFICAESREGIIGVDGLEIRVIDRLFDLVRMDLDIPMPYEITEGAPPPDFRDIAGHESAKRVLQIAAAGSHGVLMIGPPGSGKTMLASCLPSILPPLTKAEMLETAMVYSVAGEAADGVLSGLRPFRAPHHSSTLAGLIGGGKPLRPGEASLAHNGVLFLDEIAEFRPSVLQALRQPLESGEITLTRAEGHAKFPARFALVAASNPCPCGYFGDPEEECTCSMARIESYQARIGGPLMDRIDMRIDVGRLPPQSVLSSGKGIGSEELAEGVLRAQEYRSWRMVTGHNETSSDAGDVGGKEPSRVARLLGECRLDQGDYRRFEQAAERYHLSGRAIAKTLGVARTIADIEQTLQVTWPQLAEALLYRVGEKL